MARSRTRSQPPRKCPAVRPPAVRPLTPKEQLFILEYLVDFNARRAAEAAGYSPKTAKVIGSQVLHRPQIAAAIAARSAELHARLSITVERVLEELATMAYAPRGYVYDKDKTAALALLGKHLRLFVEKVEIGGESTFTLKIRKAKGGSEL